MERRAIELRGRVQGVGLRPFAARAAERLRLSGSVRNAGGGVRVELEGPARAIDAWLDALYTAPPPGARVESLRTDVIPCRNEPGFRIAASDCGPAAGARVPPDAAVCGECTIELFDPASRRHRYAFTHCAVCGPRAAVLDALPYDRARTSLAAFPPCAACAREYADPADRRFHAEAIACPRCGPRLRAREPDGTRVAGDPVEIAAARLRAGAIVAVKGYGGFHLACDASAAEAVARLRKRKGRPVKPFAVLVPDLAAARSLARLSPEDEELLAGPVRAVVVAPRRIGDGAGDAPGLADAVAPRTDDVGLLLPYAPVHWLLLYTPGDRPGRDAPRFRALVFTSANRSGAPTLHGNDAARAELAGVADLLLEHDRATLRPNDDPVYRSARRGPIPVRLSRATAPLALPLPGPLRAAPAVLAVGGDLKCAPALVARGEVVVGEHVGDLENADAADALERRAADLCRLVGAAPDTAACDLHPEYTGTAIARRLAPRVIGVQHHHAHAVAALVEHGRTGPALALLLDGAGYGPDGTIWGGELLRVDLAGFERLARLERVPLPGGDAAAREPWRMAASWLGRAFPDGAPRLAWHARRAARELDAAVRLCARGGRFAPATSSCGRLFDAAASLLDCGDVVTHEGEAAIALESLAARAGGVEPEPAPAPETPEAPVRSRADAEAESPGEPDRPRVLPADDLVRALVLAHARGEAPASIARRFHEALADRLSAAVVRAAAETGLREVVLSGGCLQNRLLLDALACRLEAAALAPLVPRRIPPNDGGLAVGQAAVAAARLLEKKRRS